MKSQVDKEVFAEVYAHTKSAQKAMIAAEPNLITKKNYANVKGHRMLKKTDMQQKIQKNLEKMSKHAIKRIDEMIQSDDEAIATTNAWRVVEQLRGKPVARNLNLNAQVTIEDVLE